MKTICFLFAGVLALTLWVPLASPAGVAPMAVVPQAAAAVLLTSKTENESAGRNLLQSTGKLTLLRVHDVGTGYGPPGDTIDGEVVIKLNSTPTKSFGFALRDDGNRPVRQGMLDILRDAWNNDWTVTINYDEAPGTNNSVLFRVWLTK